MDKPITIESLLLLLQTGDPLFPSGSYAHSFGLEEVVRMRLVHDEVTLLEYLTEQVLPNLQNLELPYLHAAYQAATRSDLPRLVALDEEIEAWKLSRESREAGSQLGRRRLAMMTRHFPHPLFAAFAALPGPKQNLAVLGLHGGVSGIPVTACLTSYAYQACASLGSASLKLIRIGQDGVQRVLTRTLHRLSETIRYSLEIELDHSGWSNLLPELASMRHESAPERLFIS